MGLQFLCGDCGRAIRDWDGRNFHWPEVRVPELVPLREILHNQMESAGRQMCRECAAKYVREKGITDGNEIERIVPWNSIDIGDRPEVPRSTE